MVTSDARRFDETRPASERADGRLNCKNPPESHVYFIRRRGDACKNWGMGLHIAPSCTLPFADRIEAGRALGRYTKESLGSLGASGGEIVVLGLPRGGMVVAGEVARILEAPLDVLPTRKLGAPGNPELAIGAVSVAGRPYLAPSASRLASEDWIERETRTQRERISAQLRIYRDDDDFSRLSGRVGLVVDDGAATGATAVAACNALRHIETSSVWVAVPVAPPEALDLLASLADEVLCLASRADFQAVGMWYLEFGQTTDEEVCEILERGA